MKRFVHSLFLAFFLFGQIAPSFIRPAHALFPAAVAAALPIGSTLLKTAAGQFLIRNAVNIVGASLTGLAVLYSQDPDSPDPLSFPIDTLTIPWFDSAPSQASGAPNEFYNTTYPTAGVEQVRRELSHPACATFFGADYDWTFFQNSPSWGNRPATVSNYDGASCSGFAPITQTLFYRFIPNDSPSSVYYGQGNPTPSFDNTARAVEIDRSSSGFSVPVDTDLNGVAGGSSGRPIVTPSVVQTQYLNDQGNPSILEVTRNTDGSTTLVESVQVGNQVEKTTVNLSTSGSVSSAGTSSAAGALSPVQTVSSSSQTAVSSPTVGAVSGGAGASLEIPADYARAGEAGAAASQVVDGLLQGDLITPTESTESMPWFGSTFDGLSPSLAVSSSCPVVSFGQTRFGSFDSSPFCEMLQPQQGFLFAIFTAVWTLLGFRVVMSA